MKDEATAKTEEKSQADIAFGAIGLWIPQSVGLAFLYAFHTSWFHREYGGRGFFDAVIEAMRGALFGTPAAYGEALAEFPFYTVLLGAGLLGLNGLHQWKRDPRELALLSMTAFVLVFMFLFYQKFL